MATDDLDITSNDWRIARENLVQLHCEDVSWEQASDIIPLDLVRYLQGGSCPVPQYFGLSEGKQVSIYHQLDTDT